MEKESVALLGLGTMGSGMAANLLKAGFPLAVYNRTLTKAEVFASQSTRVAETPSDAANGAKIILSMLADDTASREAWLGQNGALAAAAKGTVLVECSTLSPAWIAELAGLAKARGLELMDVPVMGSRLQAAGGQLSFLVGGSPEALSTATPVLQAMSKEIASISAQWVPERSLKLVNNFSLWSACQHLLRKGSLGWSEAVWIATRLWVS